MGKAKDARIKSNNQTRQEFLRTFFDKNEYQEIEVNGFWLVQHWSGNTNDWEVAIYTKESFAKRADFLLKSKDTSNPYLFG